MIGLSIDMEEAPVKENAKEKNVEELLTQILVVLKSIESKLDKKDKQGRSLIHG